MIVKFKKLKPEAKLPTYAHPGDLGMDIYSAEDLILKPGDRHMFSTGIAAEIEEGYGIIVKDKGGFGAKGIHVFAGVIDQGYRGEWFVVLVNLSKESLEVKTGNKIAQGVVIPVIQAEVSETDQLSETERGEGRLGSTGK